MLYAISVGPNMAY